MTLVFSATWKRLLWALQKHYEVQRSYIAGFFHLSHDKKIYIEHAFDLSGIFLSSAVECPPVPTSTNGKMFFVPMRKTLFQCWKNIFSTWTKRKTDMQTWRLPALQKILSSVSLSAATLRSSSNFSLKNMRKTMHCSIKKVTRRNNFDSESCIRGLLRNAHTYLADKMHSSLRSSENSHLKSRIIINPVAEKQTKTVFLL